MWQKLDRLIEDSIEKGLPSAQILIEKSGEIIKESSYGRISPSFSPEILAHSGVLYDIASLTKIFAGLYPALLNSLPLDRPLSQWRLIKERPIRQAFHSMTLRHLLMHRAGFEPNPLFYDRAYSEALFCQEREKFIDSLLKAPLQQAVDQGALYSDVDYMLLTFLIESEIEESLADWFQRALVERYGIRHATFTPLKSGYQRREIAPTELHGNSRGGGINFENMRREPIWGEVQDEKAFHCLEGVSSHAGLFASARGVLELFRLFYLGELFKPYREIALTPKEDAPTFGLGFRLNRGEEGEMAYHFGDYASQLSYGHTGWTGCMMMHDPQFELTIIYLTNRKHTEVVNPKKDTNLFLGDQLPAGRYRNVVNEVYRALKLD